MRTHDGGRARRLALAALLLAPLYAGCATQVKSDRDPRASFSAYRTFAVTGGKLRARGVEVNDVAALERIRAAVGAELQDKGLLPTAGAPDVLVTYTADAVGVEDSTGGPGLGWWSLPPELWDRSYVETRLVIDVTDAATGKLVYRATALAEPRDLASQRFIRRAVARALAGYPSPPGA
jgi:hypothetical protein